MAKATSLFEGGEHASFVPYFAELGRCKNLEQWKARIVALDIPKEVALACRSINDCGRVLAMRFIGDKGQPVSADLISNTC